MVELEPKLAAEDLKLLRANYWSTKKNFLHYLSSRVYTEEFTLEKLEDLLKENKLSI